ncbi:MAG: hypothetical protein A3E94_02010 [Candidatus Zambryskibacteria bacterium RIFCSPHIGHO2_12_FULL_44_12b]|nr:MAG: hypothetical protein A3E94_02010 [Candidatus Zambryskibacteria bacterium RIFCSPHIGHO2_12_FULL_44_12b]
MNINTGFSYWRKITKKEKQIAGSFAVLVLLGIFNALFWSPPRLFPAHTILQIKDGDSLSAVASQLEGEKLVRSVFWFKVSVVLSGGSGSIRAGDYFFNQPADVFSLSRRLTQGNFNLTAKKVTIPEGFNIFQIAELLETQFDLFDPEEFLSIAKEGMLFPDTYFFPQNIDAMTVAKRMEDNFLSKFEELKPLIDKSGKSPEEILIMASIVEEEANTPESRRIVSGILWKRIEIDMALQVDASFAYVNGKGTYSLTRNDLATDSPYNTYTNTGLPPGPISSPGLDSLKAAIEPQESDYLYFLHDLDGNIYYAKDFDGHQLNRERYLRK